jgi:spore coat assembly protein
MVKPGDLVSRRSYGRDLLFEIYLIDQYKNVAWLKGLDVRLLADSPLDDLIKVKREEVSRYEQVHFGTHHESLRLVRQQRKLQKEKNSYYLKGTNRSDENYFEVPGKVLHLDGDPKYLQKCLNLYKELQIPVEGYHIVEKDMPDAVARLLPQINPDILVITGHDGILKNKKANEYQDLTSYRNSKNFVRAVREARNYERNRDVLTIIAGACQSHFEALIHAGANFASSPQRILIHALDPVFVSEKIAYTSIRETINIIDVIKNTITGMDGLGGIESKGSYRLGFPRKISHTEEKNQEYHEYQGS